MFSDLIVTVDLTEPSSEDTAVDETRIESEGHKQWRNKRQEFITQHLNGQEPTEAAMQIIIAAIGPEPSYEAISESIDDEDDEDDDEYDEDDDYDMD